MTTFRLVFRTIAMAVCTFGWFFIWALGLLVAWPLGRRFFWRDRILYLWSWSLVRVLSIRVRSEGPIPRGGCLVVSNHLSYLDVVILASQRPLCFLSKADVKHWPVLGFMARSLGILFIERGDKRALPAVAALLKRELDAGHGLVVFPEGTSSGGEHVLPFRPSVLAPAADGGLPVAFATLHYATPAGAPPAHRSVCWWGDMTFGPHMFGVFKLPRIEARVRWGTERIAEGDRKVLARKLHDAVSANFEPVP